MPYNKPQEVLKELVHSYYEERNIDSILSCVTDDVEWIGTESNETARGKEELAKLLETDFAAFPNTICVALEEPSMQVLGAEGAVLTLTGEKLETPGSSVGFSIRGTVCCVKKAQGWLISNIHMSAPNAEIDKSFLKNALIKEQAKQKTVLDNVPGGIAIYHIKKNGKVTTEYVSVSLAKMCGYTAEEFLARLQEDALVNLVPEDIPLVNEAVKKSIEEHQNISMVYHIYKKDKTPILIRLDAKIIESESLQEDEIAIFYAVHTIVSEESKRIMEEQKFFGRLLNSVPVGIGIFEMKNSALNLNYMNDAFFEMLHSTREERKKYSGKNSMAAIHPDDLPGV